MAEKKSSKGTVAIVGSGPAGIFAAWALQADGFDVTIFDKVRGIPPDRGKSKTNKLGIE